MYTNADGFKDSKGEIKLDIRLITETIDTCRENTALVFLETILVICGTHEIYSHQLE